MELKFVEAMLAAIECLIQIQDQHVQKAVLDAQAALLRLKMALLSYQIKKP